MHEYWHSTGRPHPRYPPAAGTLADQEQVLGPAHPDTLNSRNNLAAAYQTAGDLGRAIPLYEATLAECERVLGTNHPATRTVRGNLESAAGRRQAGRGQAGS
jgi:hypothetical protein